MSVIIRARKDWIYFQPEQPLTGRDHILIMKTVATFSQAEEAYILRAFLAANGIESIVRDDVTATVPFGLSNAEHGVKVDVAEGHYANALALMAAAKESSDS